MNSTNKHQHNLRKALGSFLTGVTVVTCVDSSGSPLGFTANSFTSVSLSPPLVIACLSKNSYNIESYKHTSFFAVNILNEQQQQISDIFSKPIEDRFSQIDWSLSHSSNPIIQDALASFDCKIVNVIEAGDHIMLMGEVIDFEVSSGSPLGYFQSHYIHLELEGHALAAHEKGAKVCAIIEHQDSIVLQQIANGIWSLPSASFLGEQHHRSSLVGQLTDSGISPSIKQLFAITEEEGKSSSFIIYQGHFTGTPKADSVFSRFPVNQLPWQTMPETIQTQLKQYLEERGFDQFGHISRPAA